MLEAVETPKDIVESDPVQFPEVTLLRPCTSLVCRAGHVWSPMIALARCGCGTPTGWNGCGTPVLAIKMQNCPFCNEPAKGLRLRVDHTPPVAYPSPICIPGGKSPAEIITIEIPFRHVEAIEQPKEPHGKTQE